MRFIHQFFLVIAFALISAAASERGADSAASSIAGGNTYSNPALGVRVVLPGKWHLTRQSAPDSSGGAEQQTPGCRGPLCGRPEINEAMETDSTPVQSLFLIGYRLQPEYLNRQRYPLKKFAETMLQGSLGGSSWVPLGDLVEEHLADRPAYRLLVRDPAKPQKKGFGFVFDANGYICLLVGSDITESQSLLPAVEKMRKADQSLAPAAHNE
jgi:hypothetical protein